MRTVLAVLSGLALGLGASVVLTEIASDPSRADREPKVLEEDPLDDVHTQEVRRADDSGLPGSVQGTIAWKFFDRSEVGGGPSPDHLRFHFDSPARIHQIQISVDMTDVDVNLLEFIAGRNIDSYEPHDQGGTPLTHVSWSAGSDDINQTAVMPPGVEVHARDFIGVVAWMSGRSPIRVSAEVVVLYEWLP